MLGVPGTHKLFLAARERGITLTQAKARSFTKTSGGAQTYATAPTLGSNMLAASINDRRAADLVGQKANRGAGGDRIILVVQDMFPRRVLARSLQCKTTSEVAAAFQSTMDTAGIPGELNTDGVVEWPGALVQLSHAKGIAHCVNHIGDTNLNEMARLTAAIGNIR